MWMHAYIHFYGRGFIPSFIGIHDVHMRMELRQKHVHTYIHTYVHSAIRNFADQQ